MKRAGGMFGRAGQSVFVLWVCLGCAVACESPVTSRQAGLAVTPQSTQSATLDGGTPPTTTATPTLTPTVTPAGPTPTASLTLPPTVTPSPTKTLTPSVTPTPTKTPTLTPTATITPTPTLPWTIILLKPTEIALPDGWKTFRVDFGISNSGQNFTSPRISVEDVKLYTTFADPKFKDSYSYPVTTTAMTGATNTRVREIVFQVKLPDKFQVWGEYQGDRVLTYCFDSQIPKGATPTFYDIRGFGKVPYNIMNWTSAFDGFTKFQQSCSQISIGDPFYFSVCNFKRDTTFHPAHDLITADLSIISVDPTKNTIVNLNYLPISERGIVGAAYKDTLDCKPLLTVGPGMTKKSQICVIVPKGEKNIKIIFTGDVNTVYDTGL